MPDLRADLAALDTLAAKAAATSQAADEQAARDLYLAVRRVKLNIMLKNPVLDFSQILLIDQLFPQGSECNHEAVHRLGIMAVPGGRLLVLDGLQLGGRAAHHEAAGGSR